MKMKDSLFKLWVLLSGSIVTAVAAGIFLYLFFKGFTVISPEFILGSPRGIPLGTEGGIFPAIAGSLMSGAIAGILGGALSLCTAVYLVFYCKSEKIRSYILHALQCLAGIPSVVVGLFGYSFLIVSMGMPKSLLSASVTLTIMIIPFITIRIKKALEQTSEEQFIGSLSLGLVLMVIVLLINIICRLIGSFEDI